jgi:heme A synthase
MEKFTRVFGIILIILGLASYFGTGMVSITALIPAFFGVVFLILGFAARKESLYKHVMHGAAVLALVGLFGSAGGLLNVAYMIGGNSVERPSAAISQAIMALLCIIFIGAAVKSFIDARKAKEA